MNSSKAAAAMAMGRSSSDGCSQRPRDTAAAAANPAAIQRRSGWRVSIATQTAPAVATAAYMLDKQLVLGLNPQEMVLLLLTFMVSMLTFGTGRTNILFGLVHVVVFAVFVFMVFVP